MKNFEYIKFKGEFRSYQKRILDNKDKYLINGKINIVASPGSGKTILGLELIKELNNPTIILSPTTTIKHQWAERFEKSFLPNNEILEDYFSFDLNEITLINSITYQALYSAINKIKCENEDEVVDYSNIDLFELIKKNHVKTICLDEAHHLQNEWQKALEIFIKGLEKDVKIISLTATPPYDASLNEWQRYINVCGEIDEEIFVPELVYEKTLCPHQDYIYFNYPTSSEIEVFKIYKEKVINSLLEINKLNYYQNIYEKILFLFENEEDFIFENLKQVVSILVVLNHKNVQINKKLIYKLTRKINLPKYNLNFLECAIQFLLDTDKICSKEEQNQIIKILIKNNTYENKKVCFSLKDNLKRKLISSVGKLDSIVKITTCEYDSLKSNLRELILTDYIRKENVNLIGTNESLTSINIVTIFESIRRKVNVNIGVISGSLVILPLFLSSTITLKHSLKKIENTDYAIFSFSGDNKIKVELVSKLFSEGRINVLIGTKSLLGEGWDSPCINTLILASFVGSFILSNQMRGRAIRIDPNNINKISNIWHLVTLEPTYIFKDKLSEKIDSYINEDLNNINSYDYFVCKRRFDQFVGPNYLTGDIESGIERITIIKPPFTSNNINKINQEMIELARNRTKIKANWDTSLNYSKEVSIETEVPQEDIIPPKVFYNVEALMVTSVLTSSSIVGFISSFKIQFSDIKLQIIYMIMMILCMILFSIIIGIVTKKIILKNSKTKILKLLGISILKTLQDMNQISYSASVKVNSSNYDLIVKLTLGNASIHEQNIFNVAINELLSYIVNPKYVIIMKKSFKRNYNYSFAVPSIIGQKKEYVELFVDYLKKNLANFDYEYTRNVEGRKILLQCRKKSFITYNEKFLNKKKKIVNYE